MLRLYEFSFIRNDGMETLTFSMEGPHPLSHEDEIRMFRELAKSNCIDNTKYSIHKTMSKGDPFLFNPSANSD